MSLVLAGLLVAVLGGIGALVAPPALRGRWLPLAAVFVLAGLLFMPVRCATGIPAGPLHDVRDQPRPTSCESVAGIGLSLGVAVVAAGRMVARHSGDPGPR